jgi:hypothetical protein
MGEIAEMMLDGTLCEGCGDFLNDEPPGYPCYCRDCQRDKAKDYLAKTPPPKPKVKCTVCGRNVKAVGLADHMKDSHEERKK